MSIKNDLNLLVSDVMLPPELTPMVSERSLFKEALEEMGRKGIGIACIVGEKNFLLGIITDGDLRRKILKVQKPFSSLLVDDALDHAIKSPKFISANLPLVSAIQLMGEEKIWDFPVINDQRELVGLLHLHPAISALVR